MSSPDELDEAIALANYRGTGLPPSPSPPSPRGTAADPWAVPDAEPGGGTGTGAAGGASNAESGAVPRTGPGVGPEPGTSPGAGAGSGPTRSRSRSGSGSGAAPRSARPGPAGRPGPHRSDGLPWPEARARAARAAGPLGAVSLPLDRALGLVLAEPVTALTDLPPFDTSAMDGWAVSGPGPWELTRPAPGAAGPDAPEALGILAGDRREPPPLPDGHAVRIATGARVPPGASAVLRSEYGEVRGRKLRTDRRPEPGTDIRPRGQECRSGDRLLPPGTQVTPAVLGLAAAAGYDELTLVRRPRAEVLVLGDELLHTGRPRDGRIRDALGPMVAPWLTALGAEVLVTRRLGDDAEALHEAVATTTADLVVTTGGTASGPVDHVHPVLERLGARLLVDGVQVRPGHPMLLARLPGPGGAHLVGLPGNPLAALSGLVTLAEPLVRALAGAATEAETGTAPGTDGGADVDVDPDEGAGRRAGAGADGARPGGTGRLRAPLAEDVHGHPRDTRLVPVTYSPAESLARPLHYTGPAMLRGIAAAQALAVVPPGGAPTGTSVRLLTLPW